jgi:uncharacterized Zn-finger protein
VSECSKRFASYGNCQTHFKRIHSGQKPFVCETCTKGFPTRQELQVHAVCHTGERPHVCETCDKRFSSTSGLYAHRKTHTEERPFSCSADGCTRTFVTHARLTDHRQRAHSGEKPYACGTCARTFSTSGDLRGHEATHAKEKRQWPCSFAGCDQVLGSRTNLGRHFRRVHTNEMIVCQVEGCGKRYATAGGLKQHEKKHHKQIKH